jgi:hypothetical protein
VQDGRGAVCRGSSDRSHAVLQALQRRTARTELHGGINEQFETFEAVALLAREVAVLVGGVLHVERIDGRETVLVGGQEVAAMSLIDGDLALVSHVVEALLRVHVCGGGNPTRRVDRGTLILQRKE